MNYNIDIRDIKPAYMQLYLQLREDIEKGVYAYGERLPSKRLLCEETGCSVITTQHSYDMLCDEGYAEARERRGYFVTYREGDLYTPGEQEAPGPGKESMAKKSRPQSYESKESAVVFPAADALYIRREFPFGVYARTVRKVLSEYGEQIFTKADNYGSLKLRRAIAAYLGRSRGIQVGAEQVIIGSGSEYLYSLVVQLFPGEKCFALESPSYEKIRQVYEAEGIECEMLKMGKDGIESRELQGAKARILHATPFHSYPSGITATAGKRAEYIRWAIERDGHIVEDDFDSEFTISQKAKDTIYGSAPEGTVVYMNTFSRTIAPSVRTGYMVIPPCMRELAKERIGFYACTVPLLEQYVLAELIAGGDLERHINRVRRQLRKGRK